MGLTAVLCGWCVSHGDGSAGLAEGQLPGEYTRPLHPLEALAEDSPANWALITLARDGFEQRLTSGHGWSRAEECSCYSPLLFILVGEGRLQIAQSVFKCLGCHAKGMVCGRREVLVSCILPDP